MLRTTAILAGLLLSACLEEPTLLWQEGFHACVDDADCAGWTCWQGDDAIVGRCVPNSLCSDQLPFSDAPTQRLISWAPPDVPGPVLDGWDLLRYEGYDWSMGRPNWLFTGDSTPAIGLDSSGGIDGVGLTQELPAPDGEELGIRLEARIQLLRKTDGTSMGLVLFTGPQPGTVDETRRLQLNVHRTGIVYATMDKVGATTTPLFPQPPSLGTAIESQWHEVILTATGDGVSVCFDGIVTDLAEPFENANLIGLFAFAGESGGEFFVGGFMKIRNLVVDRLLR